MRRLSWTLTAVMVLSLAIGGAWETSSGEYKILRKQKNDDLGYFDYVFADSANRRLYMPRRAMPDTTPPAKARIVVYDLDTLAKVGEIPDIAAAGAVVDVKSGHGFSSSNPVAMWDAKTLRLIKTIDVDGAPDPILDDPFNQRIYVMSHRPPYVTVIDAKTGVKLGTIDVEGKPEEAVSDGKGTVYIDVYDKGYVAVIDAAGMKMKGRFDVGPVGPLLFRVCQNRFPPH
jgi:DNA-binding beta-propeller fold protein YncE